MCIYANSSEKKQITKSGYAYVPPASLRFRVSGNTKMNEFMDSGKRITYEIERALKEIGKDLDSFEKVLDFGCGCGRTLIWFSNRKSKIYGTDIDADAIRWARKNLDFGIFSVNASLPPLEFPDNTFDFIYTISVFTHLNEDYQFLWLKELKRVLKPDGILILTVHGETYLKDLTAANQITHDHLRKLHETGFTYLSTYDMPGIFPSWYSLTFHTKWYVLNKFSQYFKVLNYIEKGINTVQDLVILQKM